MKQLILILSFLFFSYANADTHEESDIKKYGFWWSTIPAVCSTFEIIHEWANDKEFYPVSKSYGRENGQSDGKIVYIVVYWINDEGQTFASVQVPNKPGEVCIVFRTFDLDINPELLDKMGIIT